MRLILSASLLALFFVGCKKDQSTWKHNDNTVRVRQLAAAKTLNPYLARTNYERAVYELIFQPLMGFDPERLVLAPQLSTAEPVVSDIQSGDYAGGQSFTFEILPEAKWDDGKPVTGYDYLFSLKIIFNPKATDQRYKNYLEKVRDVQVDAANPKRFTVFTNKKYFLNTPAIANITLLPAHVYDAGGLLSSFALKDLTDPAKAAALAADPKLQQFADAFAAPVFSRETVSGSGPYKLVEWVDDQRIVLAKKQNWWGASAGEKNLMLAARPDTLIFIPIPDAAAAAAALKDESIDVATEMDATQFKELRGTDFVKKIYNFFTPATYVYFYTALNNQSPELADKRVRRALAHLLDVDFVRDNLYDGLAERQIGPFFSDSDYFNKDLKPVAFNLEKARRLLTEAGWTDSNNNGTVDKMVDGKPMEMKLQYIYTPTSANQTSMSELFRTNAQKVGVEVERVGVESSVLADRMRSGDYDLAGRGAGWQPIPDDPKQLWHSENARPGGSNYARFASPTADSLIEAIQNAPDDAARKPLYLRFQALIVEEQPVIFLISPQERIVVHQRFEPVVSRMGLSLATLKLRN